MLSLFLKKKSSNLLVKDKKKFRKGKERTKEKAGERKEGDINVGKKAKKGKRLSMQVLSFRT